MDLNPILQYPIIMYYTHKVENSQYHSVRYLQVFVSTTVSGDLVYKYTYKNNKYLISILQTLIAFIFLTSM